MAGGWYAFLSNIPGHSFVDYEATGKGARNEAIKTGTTQLGPYTTRRDAALVAGSNKPPPDKTPSPRKKKGANVSGARIVAIARTWLGVQYLYGGNTRQGVDCSGLVQNVAFEAGIAGCPRTSEEQWAWVHKIDQSQAGAGDLVFFVGAELDPPPGHVSIIVHPGRVISADTTGTVVRYDNYSDSGTGTAKVIGYGRMPGASFSRSANYNLAGKQQMAGGSGIAASAAGSVGGLIATLAVILFVVLLFAALVLVAIWYKG